MHTKTHLKAALHQLSLAKVETRDLGHDDLADQIARAEDVVVALVKKSYAVAAEPAIRPLRVP